MANRNDRQNKRRAARKLQTERFLKSMQLLQANAHSDPSQPFEDYSIFLYRQTAQNFEDRVKDLEKKFTYVPDHENKPPSNTNHQTRPTGTDDEIQARIRSIEDKWKEPEHVDKKPKDLLRAIGKIETSDWNIKEIEKKIRENKMGKPTSSARDKEKVPKWSKEQFVARQTKMEKQHLDRQDSAEAKYVDIDKNLKHLDLKLREGLNRDLGQNKVASITEKLSGKAAEPPKVVQKSQSKPAVFVPSGSEYCHFCAKRVYLMERLSAEGRFFHHGCFKCQYCHTQLRLGSYAFDRDGFYGYKFFCIHHYGMQGEVKVGKVERKPSQRAPAAGLVEKKLGITGVDLLDRVQTPERVEFNNATHPSDQDESPMDEDEWTDKNFGASAAEQSSEEEDDEEEDSDITSSSDDEDYEEALEEPTKEGTLKWAERLKKRYSKKHEDYTSSESSYYDSSDDDDSDTATEGEDDIRALELRKQEVRLEPPIVQTDTGTDTEVVSEETSESSSTSDETSSRRRNSATEISTDSEFALDEQTPTREIPAIVFNDQFVTKRRRPQKQSPAAPIGPPPVVKVTASTNHAHQRRSNGRIELTLSPLVPSTPSHLLRKNVTANQNFPLNRTQSTGGIATKVSLELKKKYLLGGANTAAGSIQKSGSASTLDTKLKSFHSNISDCQKLLQSGKGTSSRMFDSVFDTKVTAVPNITVDVVGDDKKQQNVETFGVDKKVESLESVEKIESLDPDKKMEGLEQDKIIESFEPVNEVNSLEPDKKIEPCEQDKRIESFDSDKKIEPLGPGIKSFEPDKNPEEPVEPDIKSWCFEPEPEGRPRSPVHETSIVVPNIDWSMKKDSKSETGSISTDSISDHEIQHDRIDKNDKFDKYDSNDKNDSRKEAKSLNKPKLLPNLSVESDQEQTNALTETELSDWAREGQVGSDLSECYEADTRAPSRPPLDSLEQLSDFGSTKDSSAPKHVCKKVEALNPFLCENIEFMDTGSESTSEAASCDHPGYMLLLSNDDEPIDSLNPVVNNTGYCIIDPNYYQQLDRDLATTVKSVNDPATVNNDTDITTVKSDIGGVKGDFGMTTVKNDNKTHVNATTPVKSVNDTTSVKSVNDMEEDSLLILDTTETTTTTCSDSTVKNLSEMPTESNNNSNDRQQRMEQKLAQIKAEVTAGVEFDEHCKRLVSRVEFGNVKDSMDVRKLRRKSKSESPTPSLVTVTHAQTPDLLREESVMQKPAQQLSRKERIERERDVNQRLVQEMVMTKMRSENKSLERKKRKSRLSSVLSTSPAPPDLVLGATVAAVVIEPPPVAPPRVKSSQQMKDEARSRAKQLTNEQLGLSPEDKLVKLRERLVGGSRVKSAEIVGGRVKSAEIIGGRVMSTEITCGRVTSAEIAGGRVKSSEMPLNPVSRVKSCEIRAKSIDELHDPIEAARLDKFCKSDPNLLLETSEERKNKKSKDRERRKSISKMIANFFTRSPSGFFSRLSPKKDNNQGCKSKSNPELRFGAPEVAPSTVHPHLHHYRSADNLTPPRTPPLVPPLPLNYQLPGDDCDSSSDFHHHSSCDTLDQSTTGGGAGVGVGGGGVSRRGERNNTKEKRRKVSKRAQVKRHRMAQEIQRKLEETEVKTRELERRGVEVEKALRGEESHDMALDSLMAIGSSTTRSPHEEQEDAELLQEWFDLMRDRTELRRYERELMVRAQELELEDRHARLQEELRERLENEGEKSDRDMETEGRIVQEMMDIVAKRDSLLATLEEERLRYTNEDRDFEEQMLAKGLRLTSIGKISDK